MWLPRLGVRLDQIGLQRQARRSTFPDPVVFAQSAEMAGADMVAFAYRATNPTVSKRDVELMVQTLGVPITMEVAPTQDMIRAAYELKPDNVTIIPDSGDELFPSEGVNIVRGREQLRSFVHNLRDGDVRAGILLEPDLDQVRNAHRIDVQYLTIYTRKLSEASTEAERRAELEKIIDVGKTASRLGLEVVVSGGLTPREVRLLATIEEVAVIVVGHWLLSRALFVGIDRAIGEVVSAMQLGPKR